jgi:hypothetical protein
VTHGSHVGRSQLSVSVNVSRTPTSRNKNIWRALARRNLTQWKGRNEKLRGREGKALRRTGRCGPLVSVGKRGIPRFVWLVVVRAKNTWPCRMHGGAGPLAGDRPISCPPEDHGPFPSRVRLFPFSVCPFLLVLYYTRSSHSISHVIILRQIYSPEQILHQM